MIRTVLLVLLVSVVGVTAQEAKAPTPPTPPSLSEVQKLTVQNAAKDVELWQLRAQAAATEYDKARAVLTKLIADVTPAGFQLNEKLDLVPVPPEKKP